MAIPDHADRFTRYFTGARCLSSGQMKKPPYEAYGPGKFSDALRDFAENGGKTELQLFHSIYGRTTTEEIWRQHGKDAALDAGRLANEAAWEQHGYPYIKVWPDMMDVLLRTPLTMQASELRMPFPVFEIDFPSERPLSVCAREGIDTSGSIRVGPIDENGPAIGSIRCVLFARASSSEVHLIGVDGQPKEVDAVYMFHMMCLSQRECFWAPFNWSVNDSERLDTILAKTDWPGFETILKLCVGVSMIGTADPAFVQHDLSDRQARRLNHADPKVREKTEREIDAQRRRFGFHMGKSINLPMHTEYSRHDPSEPTGRELSWGHLRRAHFGWRKCKEGNELVWRLRPVKMARVRADLPLKPSRGYEIAEKSDSRP